MKLKRPWYREPFVWLLILFPASAVFAGMFTISLAINSNDGLVVDDYYKQGLEINRTLKRDKAAARHGLDATFKIEQQFVHLNLNAHPDYNLPNQITLRFSHRTRSGFDKEVFLERIGDNRYQGTLPELIVGAFFIQLAADDWRLLKSVRLPMTQALHIEAEG
jgi:hypothetical protein